MALTLWGRHVGRLRGLLIAFAGRVSARAAGRPPGPASPSEHGSLQRSLEAGWSPSWGSPSSASLELGWVLFLSNTHGHCWKKKLRGLSTWQQGSASCWHCHNQRRDLPSLPGALPEVFCAPLRSCGYKSFPFTRTGFIYICDCSLDS